jgi:hypothetical protein
MAIFQAALTIADANILTVWANMMLYTAVCIEMDRGNFEHCNCRTPMM